MKTLFQRLLGPAFETLPPAVRSLHSVAEPTTFTGRTTVQGSWVGSLLGFPKSGYDLPIRFRLDPWLDGRELWGRDFGSSSFITILSQRGMHLVETWNGLVQIELALEAAPEGIAWKIAGNRFCGLPVPRFFWPVITAREYEVEGRYHFMVNVSGIVNLSYSGWLEPFAAPVA